MAEAPATVARPRIAPRISALARAASAAAQNNINSNRNATLVEPSAAVSISRNAIRPTIAESRPVRADSTFTAAAKTITCTVVRIRSREISR